MVQCSDQCFDVRKGDVCFDLELEFVFYFQKPDSKSTLWNTSGLNIDIDNLMSSPKTKATATTSAPSMNQLASGGTAGSVAASQPIMGSSSVGPAAPNYNINTSMVTSAHGTGTGMGPGGGMGMRPGGMGMRPGGMGMMGQQAGFGPPGGGMGMNYGGMQGGMGMGYGGGMGVRPGGFGGGFAGQPGYGGMGGGPMGMTGVQQQQQRPF